MALQYRIGLTEAEVKNLPVERKQIMTVLCVCTEKVIRPVTNGMYKLLKHSLLFAYQNGLLI